MTTPTHYVCDFCFEVTRIQTGLTFYCKKCKGKLWRFTPDSEPEQPQAEPKQKTA